MNRFREIFKIVLIYVIFGSCWIYFSDTVLGLFIQDPAIITRFSIYKGLLFIVATALLLTVLVARFTAKINKSTEALRESEERLHFLVKNSSDSLVIIGGDGIQRYVSPAAENITGYAASELEGKPLGHILHPDDMAYIDKVWREVVDNPERAFTVQYRHIHKTKGWVTCEAVAQSFLHLPAIGGVIASVRDISDRMQAKEESDKLREQLDQAQKMESIGRLAGGVAHDFNNMLSVILGYSDLALELANENRPLREALEEIDRAARKSADLTRQLLAFARKQVIAPKVIDLNKTVGGTLKMLHRLIGEDIELRWQPGENLWLVKMDPTQIDQILANLCVNARDAIGNTGTVSIETANVTVDERHLNRHPELPAGDYVTLSVTDNGCGMDEETLSHLFEPFFTTKKTGVGTGLGLATVYGVVRQNSGFLDVESEIGVGTSFRIYMPRQGGESPDQSHPVKETAGRGGNETILLVEDDSMILKMTTKMLQRLGYAVLPASAPGDALRLAQEHEGEIALLITDVIMPEMNGRELASHIASLYPHISLLFMSGYTADIIADHGVLDESVHFIEKPFSKDKLAVKVRAAMMPKNLEN